MGITESKSPAKKHTQNADTTLSDDGETDPISYEEAINRMEAVAESQYTAQRRLKPERTPLVSTSDGETFSLEDVSTANVAVVSIIDAVGLNSVHTIHASSPTPSHDISVADGFTVCSELTRNASPSRPVKLRLLNTAVDLAENPNDNATCVEIASGSPFPNTSFPGYDAVVKLEDVELSAEDLANGEDKNKYILVTNPVVQGQCCRAAGSEFKLNQVVLWAGETIRPRHVMALAAVGIGKLEVVTEDNRAPRDGEGFQFRAAVLSVSSHCFNVLQSKRHDGSKDDRDKVQETPDGIGPYLCASLKYVGLCPGTKYLGIVPNDEEEILKRMSSALESNTPDVLITSGGATIARFDLVRKVVENRLGGKVVFHSVRIHPGMSVLFATITTSIKSSNRTKPNAERVISLFGLPADPLAAGACLRFLVVPYLTMLKWRCHERPSARGQIVTRQPTASPESCSSQSSQPGSNTPTSLEKPVHLTVFCLGIRSRREEASENDQAEYDFLVLEDQASYKIQNLLAANCWGICPEGTSTFNDRDSISVTSLL